MSVLRYSAFFLTALLSACSPPADNASRSPALTEDRAGQALPDRSGFAAHLGLSAYTEMSMAAQAAQELDAKLAAFLYQPGNATLESTRNAWRKAYDTYLSTLLYAQMPLNDPPDWARQGIGYQQTLMLLDSWPAEGGYIDHVPGYPFSGIVNDLTLELNEETLQSQHRFSDATYVSLGYHAFEFMLWGADGNRAPRDFLPQENTAPVLDSSEPVSTDENTGNDMGTALVIGPEATAADISAGHEQDEQAETGIQNHNRRRQYVQLVSEQLQKHLHRLQRRWEPSNGHYASVLQHAHPDQVLRASLLATQRLLSDELLGKRLNGNSSEFSHTSWADVRAIVQGIQNLYLPVHDTEQPEGLASLLRDRDLALLNEWQQQFSLIQDSLSNWQQSGDADATVRQLCRQRLIELMSLLQRTASALNVTLPSAN